MAFKNILRFACRTKAQIQVTTIADVCVKALL